MRMRYWASAVAAAGLFAAPQGRLALPSGGSIRYTTAASKTRFEIRNKAGKRYLVNVNRDATVSPKAEPNKVELIGEVPGKAFILSDSYASVPLGMSYCEAGEERFLRVLTLANGGARQTLQLKLASCRDNIELAEPGVEWNPHSENLQIHWLQGPSNKGKNEDDTIHIGVSGRPESGQSRDSNERFFRLRLSPCCPASLPKTRETLSCSWSIAEMSR